MSKVNKSKNVRKIWAFITWQFFLAEYYRLGERNSFLSSNRYLTNKSIYINFPLELMNRNVTRVHIIISLIIIYSFYLLLEYIYDLKVKRYACKQETHDAEKLLWGLRIISSCNI